MRLLCDKDALQTVQNEFNLQSLRQMSARFILNAQPIAGRFSEAVFTSTYHNSCIHYYFARCVRLSQGNVSSVISVIFLVASVVENV